MIYFIQVGGPKGPVKIGVSTDVNRRLRVLATAHYEPLTVIATVDAPDKAERELHDLLRPHRIQGEWFCWCDAVSAAVEMARRGEWLQSAVTPSGNQKVDTPLQDALDQLGGTTEAARLLFPEMEPKARYDRVFRWRERGQLPNGHAALLLANALKQAGHELPTDDLLGMVGRPAA